jgi:hypothetical protein
MGNRMKLWAVTSVIFILIIGSVFVYFRYFFTYEQRNVFKRKIGTITGMNMTITVFGYDGRIIKRWKNVQRITSGRGKGADSNKSYTYFYTKDNKYVQIPDSVWYVAEEE